MLKRSGLVRVLALVCAMTLVAGSLSGCVPAAVAGVAIFGMRDTGDIPIVEIGPNSDGDSGADYGGSWGGSAVRPRDCAYCRNTGKIDCPACGGDGGKYEYYSAPNYSGSLDGPNTSKVWQECWRCKGGRKIDCYHCDN